MIQSIYYQLSSLFYKTKIQKIGRNCKIRFGGRMIGGSYIKLGNEVVLAKGFVFATYPQYGGVENPVKLEDGKGIIIGNRVSANRNLTIYCADKVEIDDYVMMGSNILITDNNHGMNPIEGEYCDQPLTTNPVFIGRGTWIGEQVSIIAGSHIGEKCIIAANSVVNGAIPPYSIAAGSPAKIIKRWDFTKNEWIRAK